LAGPRQRPASARPVTVVWPASAGCSPSRPRLTIWFGCQSWWEVGRNHARTLPRACATRQKPSKSTQKAVSVRHSLQLEREFPIRARQIALQHDFFRSLLRRTSRRRAPECRSPSSGGFGGVSCYFPSATCRSASRHCESCFGVAAELSKVHWVRLEMVEVSCAEWAPGRLLRQVVYLGEYGDNPATDVRRSPPG
jgi:hypothetical protein